MFFKCEYCSELFSRRDYLKRHVKEYHEGGKVKHYNCSKDGTHNQCDDILPIKEINGIVRKIKAHAFGNALREIRFQPKDEIVHPFAFFECVNQLVKDTLEILTKERSNFKIVTKLCVEFEKMDNTDLKDESYFSVPAIPISNYDFDKISSTLDSKIDNYIQRGSNWKISKTLFLELQICKTF